MELKNLLEQIEESMRAEGFLKPTPPARCWCCGVVGTNSDWYEGAYIEGEVCEDCWSDVDTAECWLGETGLAGERWLPLGDRRHAFFLEGANGHRELRVCSPDGWVQLDYFDATDMDRAEMAARIHQALGPPSA